MDKKAPDAAAQDDPELRARVGRLLRYGSVLGGSLMALGLALAALNGAQAAAAWIKPGILVMILTPVLRVALIAVGFGLNRQWRFCGVSAGVLALLGWGIFLGLRH